MFSLTEQLFTCEHSKENAEKYVNKTSPIQNTYSKVVLSAHCKRNVQCFFNAEPAEDANKMLSRAIPEEFAFTNS